MHSPFAFHFISKVVRNRRPFYCFEELALLVGVEASRRDQKRQRRICELLFRTAHELRIDRVVHFGPAHSPLRYYLEQTGYLASFVSCTPSEEARLTSLPAPQLIVIEDAQCYPLLLPLLVRWRQEYPQLILAGYTLGRSAYASWEACLETAPPRLQLDLLDLQLAFYDERLTPTSYKAVY